MTGNARPGIRCPSCGSYTSCVTDTRPTEGIVRRRRECLSCRTRFTTYELRDKRDRENERRRAPR